MGKWSAQAKKTDQSFSEGVLSQAGYQLKSTPWDRTQVNIYKALMSRLIEQEKVQEFKELLELWGGVPHPGESELAREVVKVIYQSRNEELLKVGLEAIEHSLNRFWRDQKKNHEMGAKRSGELAPLTEEKEKRMEEYFWLQQLKGGLLKPEGVNVRCEQKDPGAESLGLIQLALEVDNQIALALWLEKPWCEQVLKADEPVKMEESIKTLSQKKELMSKIKENKQLESQLGWMGVSAQEERSLIANAVDAGALKCLMLLSQESPWMDPMIEPWKYLKAPSSGAINLKVFESNENDEVELFVRLLRRMGQKTLYDQHSQGRADELTRMRFECNYIEQWIDSWPGTPLSKLSASESGLNWGIWLFEYWEIGYLGGRGTRFHEDGREVEKLSLFLKTCASLEKKGAQMDWDVMGAGWQLHSGETNKDWFDYLSLKMELNALKKPKETPLEELKEGEWDETAKGKNGALRL